MDGFVNGRTLTPLVSGQSRGVVDGTKEYKVQSTLRTEARYEAQTSSCVSPTRIKIKIKIHPPDRHTTCRGSQTSAQKDSLRSAVWNPQISEIRSWAIYWLLARICNISAIYRSGPIATRRQNWHRPSLLAAGSSRASALEIEIISILQTSLFMINSDCDEIARIL